MLRKDLDPNTAAELLLNISLDMLFNETREDDTSGALGLDESNWIELAEEFGYEEYQDLQVDLFEYGKRFLENF